MFEDEIGQMQNIRMKWLEKCIIANRLVNMDKGSLLKRVLIYDLAYPVAPIIQKTTLIYDDTNVIGSFTVSLEDSTFKVKEEVFNVLGEPISLQSN